MYRFHQAFCWIKKWIYWEFLYFMPIQNLHNKTNYFSTTNWESFSLSKVLSFQETCVLSSRADWSTVCWQLWATFTSYRVLLRHHVTKDINTFSSTASRGCSPFPCHPCASFRAHTTMYCGNIYQVFSAP